MKINRTYKFRLKPNAAQEAVLRTICAGVRMVYNAANEQRIMYGRAQGTDPHGRNSFFNSNRQDKELGYRACKTLRGGELIHEIGIENDPELRWIAENVPKDSITYALKDLDQAWDKFFKNVKNGEAKKLPGYRAAATDSSFRMRVWAKSAGRHTPVCLFSRTHVRLTTPQKSKLKYLSIPYVKHRKLRGDLREVTVKLEGARWYICVSAEIEIADPAERDDVHVGIDVGTKIAFALSDESHIPFERTDAKLTKRQKMLQRQLSRMKKGSNRRRRVRAELARISTKEAARKRASLHQITTDLVREFTHIGIENLSVRGMTKSAKTRRKEGKKTQTNKVQAAFNRAFLEVPKYAFRSMLEYKAPAHGAHVVAVNPAFTSQTCARCGHVSKTNRMVQDRFNCSNCGHEDHADVNAAKNIHKAAFPNAILGSIGVVVTPRKTPSTGRNSEKRKSSELAQVQNPAASKPIVSLFEGRGGTHSQDHVVEESDNGVMALAVDLVQRSYG